MFKVRFKREVHRFPHFIVPIGTTGTLVLLTNTTAAVLLDEPLRGCEDWDNKVYWEADIEAGLKEMKLDLETAKTPA